MTHARTDTIAFHSVLVGHMEFSKKWKRKLKAAL